MKKSWLLYFFILSIVILSCNYGSGKRKSNNENGIVINGRTFFVVEKIVDGDTFWVNDGSPKGMKVRLIGVDAPESRKTFKKEIGYFGLEAKNYLKNLLHDKNVRLEYDLQKKDRFGRTLAYVFLQNGTFINACLVKNGYAMIMTVPPNVKYAEYFLKLQKEARQNKRGLWAN